MSSFFEAYVAGGGREWLGGHFAHASDRDRAREVVRPIDASLADELEGQNAALAPSPARERHLAALRRGAAAVITGQQVGLFLGPLYNFYKAATAVRCAAALSEQWRLPVVPVFWLQTEDHDLAEIATTWAPARSRGEPLCMSVPADDARVSVEHRALPAEVGAALQQLGAELEHAPHAAEHLAKLAAAYTAGRPWSEAFVRVMAELFAGSGLVFFNPRRAPVSRLAAPLMRRAFDDAGAIAHGLLQRQDELTRAGFATTVHVREGAPLWFFHGEGPQGPRHRLEVRDGAWAEIGGGRTHTAAELLRALESEPLRFSTSALLRPILQDTLFPTAAYVGGPAEVAYFAQLPPVYARFGVRMPLVVPRMRARIVDDKHRKLLARCGLDAAGCAAPTDEVLRRARASGCGEPGAAIAKRLTDAFEAAMAREETALRAAGQGLDTAVTKTRGNVAQSIGKLVEKYDSARLHKDEALVGDVERLRAWLHPRGAPQERVFGISYFAAHFGEQAMVEKIVAHAEPFSTKVEEISP